jgi:hypothetical protein
MGVSTNGGFQSILDRLIFGGDSNDLEFWRNEGSPGGEMGLVEC